MIRSTEMMFWETYPLHLPFFLLDVPFRDGIPLFIAARFALFVGAFKVGLEDVLLIWGMRSQDGDEGTRGPNEFYH